MCRGGACVGGAFPSSSHKLSFSRLPSAANDTIGSQPPPPPPPHPLPLALLQPGDDGKPFTVPASVPALAPPDLEAALQARAAVDM